MRAHVRHRRSACAHARRATLPPNRLGWLVLFIVCAVPACDGLPTRPLFGSATGLLTRDIRTGIGARADTGMVATIHYDLRVEGETEIIDSSYERNQPFTFVIGAGRVIQGLDQGVVGMRVRGLRELVIPPDMAYGDRGYPPLIPARATLRMRVELLDLSP